MSEDIQLMLRAVFDQASEHLTPRVDLADVVRAAIRRRRRTGLLAGCLAVLVLIAGGGFVVAAARQHRPDDRPGILAHPALPKAFAAIPRGAGVQALATSGLYLYAATDFAGNPPYLLAAYDKATGVLVNSVRLPAMPYALRTGPGGSVWITFDPDQGGGPLAIWLLTPDLGLYSIYRGGPSDVLPVGRATALLSWQGGLKLVAMPPPGQRRRATASQPPADSIAGRFAVGRLARAGGRVAAQVTDGAGQHSQLVIAGHPGMHYGGGAHTLVGGLAAEGGAFWVTTGSAGASYAGPLVRLSPELRVTTPAAVTADRALAVSQYVWTSGSTVWVMTAKPGHRLVCFADHHQVGPVITVLRRGTVAALAAIKNTVYLSLATDVTDVSSAVIALPVPAACQ